MTGDVYIGDRLHQVYGRDRTHNPAAAAPRGGGGRIGSSSGLGPGTVRRRREDLGISGDQTGALESRGEHLHSSGWLWILAHVSYTGSSVPALGIQRLATNLYSIFKPGDCCATSVPEDCWCVDGGVRTVEYKAHLPVTYLQRGPSMLPSFAAFLRFPPVSGSVAAEGCIFLHYVHIPAGGRHRQQCRHGSTLSERQQ